MQGPMLPKATPWDRAFDRRHLIIYPIPTDKRDHSQDSTCGCPGRMVRRRLSPRLRP